MEKLENTFGQLKYIYIYLDSNQFSGVLRKNPKENLSRTDPFQNCMVNQDYLWFPQFSSV